jgi:modulator of FtsH protease
MTLIFSSLTAIWSLSINVPFINPIVTIIVYFGLLFAINITKNSFIGLSLTFVLTGFLGWTLGPILNFYLTTFSNGSELIMMSLSATGLIFVALSAISLHPSRDFSSLGSFLAVGSLVALVAIVVNCFLQMPALHLALSVMIALISGGSIMWQTNQIVRGGETNCILATIAIYISLLNIFLTILQFSGMFGGTRD